MTESDVNFDSEDLTGILWSDCSRIFMIDLGIQLFILFLRFAANFEATAVTLKSYVQIFYIFINLCGAKENSFPNNTRNRFIFQRSIDAIIIYSFTNRDCNRNSNFQIN